MEHCPIFHFPRGACSAASVLRRNLARPVPEQIPKTSRSAAKAQANLQPVKIHTKGNIISLDIFETTMRHPLNIIHCKHVCAFYFLNFLVQLHVLNKPLRRSATRPPSSATARGQLLVAGLDHREDPAGGGGSDAQLQPRPGVNVAMGKVQCKDGNVYRYNWYHILSIYLSTYLPIYLSIYLKNVMFVF